MFLLVQAHPGCAVQNPESYEMVVCACVCGACMRASVCACVCAYRTVITSESYMLCDFPTEMLRMLKSCVMSSLHLW